MSEVSNKILVVLLVVAIITVLGSFGTIISKLGFGANLITGLATVQYGTVNVTVQSTASINMVYANMSFGSGTLDFNADGSIRNTTINSTRTSITSYNSFQASIADLQYRVDGNADVNVSYTGTTAANFVGGTGPAFKINITNNEASSCTYIPFNSSRPEHLQYNLSSDVVANSQTVCNFSNWEDASDTVNISVWLWIPSDVATGLKSATITLTAGVA